MKNYLYELFIKIIKDTRIQPFFKIILIFLFNKTPRNRRIDDPAAFHNLGNWISTLRILQYSYDSFFIWRISGSGQAFIQYAYLSTTVYITEINVGLLSGSTISFGKPFLIYTGFCDINHIVKATGSLTEHWVQDCSVRCEVSSN